MKQPRLDDNTWYLLSRGGIVTTFSDGTTFNKLGRVLDIRDRVDTEESGTFGALSFALHPDFITTGDIFIAYTQIDPQSPPANPTRTIYVSRFTWFPGDSGFDPDSEVVLLSMPHQTEFHTIGNMEFGDDGYLYIGTGYDAPSDAAQDPDSLRGKVLRIDVDSGAPYGIPHDNPYAPGGTDPGDGLPEIYASGFRMPWRWSFDRSTGELWLGDVGARDWEEVNIIDSGGNYGWDVREGLGCFGGGGCPSAGFEDPVYVYPHNGPAAVIGGYVYRGSQMPFYAGRYFFGDNPSGEIYTLDIGGSAPIPATLELGLSGELLSFAQGNDGELYALIQTGAVRLEESASGAPSGGPANRLSDTGCYPFGGATLNELGMIPYTVNAELWSDGATKTRWMAVPDSNRIHVEPDGDFTYPIGTVLVKHFAFAATPIETRLLVRHDDGDWAGYSYEWNTAGTNATLVPAAGKDKPINGIVPNQVWRYPSRAQCLVCHTDVAGRTLGLETAQLNGDLTYPSTGTTANQMATLAHIGMFDATIAEPEQLPVLARYDDASTSVDVRSRSYLHANCSFCHRPGGPGRGNENFLYYASTDDTNTIDRVPLEGTFGIPDARLIYPGSPSQSVLLHRLSMLTSGRMPPLATSVVDTQGQQLITRWIQGLGPFARGHPSFVKGVDRGVFIGKTVFDGAYRIQVNGNSQVTDRFRITMVCDRPVAVQPRKLEASDTLIVDTYGFEFEAIVKSGLDEVRVTPANGGRCLMSVLRNGVVDMDSIFLGNAGIDGFAAGWTKATTDLTRLTTFDSSTRGTHIGLDAAGNTIRVRAASGPSAAAGEITVMLTNAGSGIAGFGLEPCCDLLESGVNFGRLSFAGTNDVDGFNLDFSGASILGLNTVENGDFVPATINPGGDRLGTPSAIWLPQAAPYDEPNVDPTNEAGLFIWKSPSGEWHVKLIAGGGNRRAAGRITANMPPIGFSGVGLESRDVLRRAGNDIVFNIFVANIWSDEFTFEYPAGADISLSLESRSTVDASETFVGAERWPLSELPVSLGGW